PAVCKSFLVGKPTKLQEYNDDSYYGPHATSLRMCDIGYQNTHEEDAGFKANYDSLDAYADSLTAAISTSCPRYEEIGVKIDGEYRQLNTNILQIENEYYSSVRPKQIPEDNEMPTLALQRRGVRYVELRSLDINMFDPQGISAAQCRFLETLMAFSLLQDSPVISNLERKEIDSNLSTVCYRGREPGLVLQRQGEDITLKQWAGEICEAMSTFASALDQDEPDDAYQQALQQQVELINDPDKTPSARILVKMAEHNKGYFNFARRMSLQHQQYFLQQEHTAEQFKAFTDTARQSLADQKSVEEADDISFDEFLKQYFAQTL
ncbi:MAG: glutamate--cysteine ligase, partial [Gammaproteobacteria bacterium]|nr:glutamate--cysteine ligase [Gammaproteobacteria bacterium]